jgi:hypothetical protein
MFPHRLGNRFGVSCGGQLDGGNISQISQTLVLSSGATEQAIVVMADFQVW